MDLIFVRERAMNLIKTCIIFSKEMNIKQYVDKTSQKQIAAACARLTESILAGGPVCGFTIQRAHPLCLL